MKKIAIFSIILGMLFVATGVVFAGNQVQEGGAMFQLWDVAPANLDVGSAERTQSGNTNGEGQPEHLFLWEKDPSDWSIIGDGAWGRLVYFSESNPNDDFAFSGYKLEQDASYELINFGTWPEVQCMGQGTTDSNGYVNIKGEMPYPLLPDENDRPDEGAKIWLVLSSDVECDENPQMTGWNPTEYLFENNLIPADN